MNPYQETELKLRLVDPALYDQIVSDPFPENPELPENRKESVYDSVYYDTSDRRLLSNGLALRVRNTGGGYVATVKDAGTVSGGLFVRGEWNIAVEGGAPSVRAFSALPVGQRLSKTVGRKSLRPLVQTTFTRISMILHTDGSLVELSADRGSIVAGGGSEPLCELELELKSGNVPALFSLGVLLAGRYPLIVENKSKFERGLLLAGITPAVKALPAVTDGKTIRDVMTEVIAGTLHKVTEKQSQFFDNPSDPETAHQCRVSLRRLRALLSFVKPVTHSGLYADIAAALKALADDFSYIRELDVVLEHWLSLCTDQVAPEKISVLEALLRSERQKEQDRLAGKMSSAPATAVLLNVWKTVLDDFWLKKADARFDRFAAGRLEKWTAAFRKGLKGVSFKDMRRTHQLRILGKKLRYVQDTLLPDEESEAPETPDLKQFQTLLGDLCDTVRNIEIVSALLSANDAPALREECRLFTEAQHQKFEELKASFKQAY